MFLLAQPSKANNRISIRGTGRVGTLPLKGCLDTLLLAATFLTFLLAGVVDEDVAHRLGCGFKEMPAVFPALPVLSANETKIALRLMSLDEDVFDLLAQDSEQKANHPLT